MTVSVRGTKFDRTQFSRFSLHIVWFLFRRVVRHACFIAFLEAASAFAAAAAVDASKVCAKQY